MKFCSTLCLLLLPLVSVASTTTGTLDGRDDSAALWLNASANKYKLDFQGDNDARQAARKHVGKAVSVTGRVAEKEDHWTIFVVSIAIHTAKKDCGCDLAGECSCAECKCGLKNAVRYKRYREASAELLEGEVLITFVACRPCECPDGCKVCRTESLAGFDGGCAVISVCEGGKHLWHSTITNPTPQKIRKPRRTFAGCESGQCVPTFFPPAPANIQFPPRYFAPPMFGGFGGSGCGSCR